jgi:5-methyltetrahydrofolate--homocysteine methyltransferase
METIVRSPQGKEVIIGEDRPTVIIGERINPFGKGPLKEAMKSGDMGPIRGEALKQVEDGADILIISVATFGIDETMALPQVTKAVMETVDVPLCLESRNPAALNETLKLRVGKPLISSVTGQEPLLEKVLPLIKEYGAGLVAMASGGAGIPKEALQRLEIARQIIARAEQLGIPRDDILVDCLAESSAVNWKATLVTLEAMERVRQELGVNLVLGASNVSFGLPLRKVLNAVFLSLAIRAGLTCAIVNAAAMKSYIMAADLLLGKDSKARRYTAYGRKLKSASAR